MIEVMKYFLSIGAVSILLKFIADRIFSTEIERALETNYQKIIRSMFDYIITVVYVLFMILAVMLILDNNQSINKENKNEQSSTYESKEEQVVSDKKIKENNSSEKGGYNDLIALVLLTSFLCAPTLYLFKDVNNKYFKRLVYEKKEQGNFLVMKKISEDKVLMKKIDTENASQQELFTIKKVDDLDILVLESYEDRKERRITDLQEIYKLFKNKKAWIFFIVMVLILYIFIVLTMKKLTVLIGPTILILVFWFYLKHNNKLFNNMVKKNRDRNESQS